MRMARPAGLEPATLGLEEQWPYSEAAVVFPAICGATHATYPRDLPALVWLSRDAGGHLTVLPRCVHSLSGVNGAH